MKQVKASSLSVLIEGSKSMHMWLKIGSESCNVSVRFNQADEATICGYPQPWYLHDYPIDSYADTEVLGKDWFEQGMIEDAETYVSEAIECTVLRAAIKGIRRQAEDDMFKDSASQAFRLKCIEQCKAKIRLLKGENK